MNEQPELNFNATLAAAKAAERLPELLRALRGRGWVNSSQLALLGFRDRELRAIVEHDLEGEIFSYPGSPGYKHFSEVTTEEFRKADALRTQGKAMIARWDRYQRRYHRRGLGA